MRALFVLVAGVTFLGIASLGAANDETAYLSEAKAAMDTMMAAMDTPPTGDVDSDFSSAMIPHHQGAIDMAHAELRYGKNERLRRIAQEIVVEQQQEIVAMRMVFVGVSRPQPKAPRDPDLDAPKK